MDARRIRRSGFTLVELLVVIAIIAMLVGLLVPAVQAARESGRRTVCSNNLRQLGMALQGRHEALQQIPFGRCYNNLRSNSWFVHVLPWLEQRRTFELFTTPISGVPTCFGVNDPSNSTFRATGAPQTVVPVMLCPSFARTTTATIDTSVAAGLFCGDYAGNYGTKWWDAYDDAGTYVGSTSNGTFPLLMYSTAKFTGLTFAQIKDGLSNTLFVGEKFIPPDQFGLDNYDNTIYTGMGHHNSMRGGRAEGLALSPYDPNATEQLFGSYHQGTVNFVFGDGRVQSLSVNIAGSVLVLLADRADRKPIPEY